MARLSRLMSLKLRHKTEVIGLRLDSDAWGQVIELVFYLSVNGVWFIRQVPPENLEDP